MDKSQRGPSGWNHGNRDDDSGKPQYAVKITTPKKTAKRASDLLDKHMRKAYMDEATRKKGIKFTDTSIKTMSNPYEPEISLEEEVDYDRHFKRQSKEVQAKINHHLRQGADYIRAARKAGATALKVGKLAEASPAGAIARRVGSNTIKYGPDAAQVATGNISSGSVGTTHAIETGMSKGAQAARAAGKVRTAKALSIGAGAARLSGAQDVINAAGNIAGRALSKLAPATRYAKGIAGKAALPVAAGLAAYDAYKGYNYNPKASTTQKLKNAGINTLSGLTFGASEYATGGMKESTTHRNGKMKTLNQLMTEARELEQDLIEQQEVVGGITNAQIFDAIAEAVGDREVTEEELQAAYIAIVESLEQQHAEMLEEETLDEEHDIELKPHPKKPGTHYVVHKINDKSIDSDQLKTGETLNDTHVDDLKDMGYKVKIHKS